MKRVLVTGGTGFVGANLVRRLLADGHQVHLLVRPGHRSWRIDAIRPDLTLHEVALADLAEVRRVVAAARPDWIFHLATHGAYSHQTDPLEIVQTNVVGTVHLLQACLEAGFEAFVNTGSSSEYGLKDHAPSEREALEPNSHYAVTKASATWFCRYTARSRGLHVPTLRLYSIYGPYEEPSRLVPTLVMAAREGKLPPLVRPTISRDFVYVDDAVEAFVQAASRPGQEPGVVYNVGSGVRTTLADLVAVARRVFDLRVEPAWGSMDDRHWDTDVWVSDPTLIRQALGWEARVGLEAGLRATAAFLSETPGMLDRYRGRPPGAR